MRIPALTTSFTLALLVAACGSSNDAGGGDASNGMSTEVNLGDDAAAGAALGGANAATDHEAATALPTDATGFATAVAASDLFEIESGRLAQAQASSAAVKNMGKMLVDQHSQSTAKLKEAAARVSPAVEVTPALDPEKQAMLDQLRGAQGADFDRLFAQLQVQAHQKTLALLQGYANGGDQQPLKAFAQDAAPAVQKHLAAIQSMAKPGA
jgi:putative membrane protein